MSGKYEIAFGTGLSVMVSTVKAFEAMGYKTYGPVVRNPDDSMVQAMRHNNFDNETPFVFQGKELNTGTHLLNAINRIAVKFAASEVGAKKPCPDMKKECDRILNHPDSAEVALIYEDVRKATYGDPTRLLWKGVPLDEILAEHGLPNTSEEICPS